MNLVWLLMAGAAGVAVAVQSGVNARTGQILGNPLPVGIVALSVGLVLSCLTWFTASAMGAAGSLSRLPQVPVGYILGGGLGAVSVMLMAASIPKVGIAAAVASMLFTQLLSALLFDGLGVWGEAIAISPRRVCGALVLLLGTWLMRR